MSEQTFDEMAAEFTARVREAADWEHSYVGAAHSTRIRAAIENLRFAIDKVEHHPAMRP